MSDIEKRIRQAVKRNDQKAIDQTIHAWVKGSCSEGDPNCKTIENNREETMSDKTRGFASCPENINRKGRPKKGTTLTELLEQYSDIPFKTEDGKKVSRKEALAQALWDLALSGDLVAIKYIYDRIDGRPVEKQEIAGDVSIQVEYV
jgi:hypothetical protein